MNAYELFALDYHLTDFDPNMAFDDVLDAMLDGDESVTVWEQFEDMPARDLIYLIRGMVVNVENRFIPKEASK